MSTPYRSAPPVGDDEDVPDFGNTPRPGRDLLWVAMLALLFASFLAFDRSENAVFICELQAVALAVAALIIVLERPVRAWLAAVHARAVVKGVSALEAKVSARQ